MATIDEIRTVERLMQTLDENPQLLEALRSRVLTRELLELPATQASLTGLVEQIAEQIAQLTERMDRLTMQTDQLAKRVEQIAVQLAHLAELVDRLTARVGQISEQLAQLTARVDQVERQLAQLTARVDQVEQQLAQLTARVDQVEQQLAQLVDSVQQLREIVFELADQTKHQFSRIADDLTWLKDVATVAIADRQAMTIAEDLGLEYKKQLSQRAVRDLIRNQDTAGIAPGDLRSFRNADMIIEAADADGQLNYIAVEISFTADQRDIDRPIRNAGYLTRFTGQPAHAVVASVRNDNRIHDIIESGQIYWHQLYAKSAPRE